MVCRRAMERQWQQYALILNYEKIILSFQSLGVLFVETSAKDGHNVDQTILQLTRYSRKIVFWDKLKRNSENCWRLKTLKCELLELFFHQNQIRTLDVSHRCES